MLYWWHINQRDMASNLGVDSKTSENVFEIMVQNMQNGVGIYQAVDDGADFIFIAYNPAGAKMDGKVVNEVVGKRVTEVFPGIEEMGLLDVFKKVYETGETIDFPVTNYKDDELEAWRENTVFKLPSGEIVAIYDDVTEQKKLEEEKKLLAKRLNIATDAAGIGIWDLDIKNDVLIWDEWMYKLYGISREQFGGAYDAWKKALHPEDLEWANKKVEEAINEVKPFHIKFRVIWPDKSIKFLEGHADFVLDDDGKPLRMIGVNWDITQEQETKLELESKVKELEKLNEILVGREVKMSELKKQLLESER